MAVVALDGDRRTARDVIQRRAHLGAVDADDLAEHRTGDAVRFERADPLQPIDRPLIGR